MENKKIRKFLGEIKRIFPLLIVILISIFLFSDAAQLEIQMYQLSMVAFVIIIMHCVRQFLFPYLSMMHLYYIARKEPIACALMFMSVMVLLSVMIIISVVR